MAATSIAGSSIRAALAVRIPLASASSARSRAIEARLLPASGLIARRGGARSFASPAVVVAAAADGAPAAAATTAADAEAAPAAPAVADVAALAQSLDLRVGRIVRAWKHPEADSLFVEEVDVGDPDGPRTICSGLVKYIPEADMQDRLVVVLANLKPRNMRGVKSNGMLLAASDASHETVELLQPPAEAAPGERVWFGAEADGAALPEAATPNQLQKKKVWEAVQPELKTTDECVATLHNKPMRVASGVVTCKSLARANIG
eukprot:TRINITY_DN78339_c0_g1_i1.p2 TRINITY_DN78339_c0_g1~~TRINITY_DN78339_c0_g1_i1.p2  ORF type:complete len:262 (+),score=12.64 TRINITY_DN78339_c0_g1_i1:79-864(+)